MERQQSKAENIIILNFKNKSPPKGTVPSYFPISRTFGALFALVGKIKKLLQLYSKSFKLLFPV